MNKFSVRYYLKCVVSEIKTNERTEQEIEDYEEHDITSTSYELSLWR